MGKYLVQREQPLAKASGKVREQAQVWFRKSQDESFIEVDRKKPDAFSSNDLVLKAAALQLRIFRATWMSTLEKMLPKVMSIGRT